VYAQAAAELDGMRRHYEAALRQARNELVEALDAADNAQEYAEAAYEDRLRQEVRAAVKEEHRRAKNTWQAHLARALDERAGRTPPTGDEMEEEIADEYEGKSPRRRPR